MLDLKNVKIGLTREWKVLKAPEASNSDILLVQQYPRWWAYVAYCRWCRAFDMSPRLWGRSLQCNFHWRTEWSNRIFQHHHHQRLPVWMSISQSALWTTRTYNFVFDLSWHACLLFVGTVPLEFLWIPTILLAKWSIWVWVRFDVLDIDQRFHCKKSVERHPRTCKQNEMKVSWRWWNALSTIPTKWVLNASLGTSL